VRLYRYEQGVKLAGIIYVHRISDVRMGGISTRNFKMFRKLCGKDAMKNVLILTNMWGNVRLEDGEAREAELMSQDMFFKPVLDKGGQHCRHYNTLESARHVLRCVIRNHPMALRIQEQLVDEKMELVQTDAGETLNRELNEQARRHAEELQSIRREMADAIRDRDEETRKELEVEYNKLHGDMVKVQTEARDLAMEYDRAKMRLEGQMQEMAQQARLEAERAAAEYQRRMEDYERRLRDAANSSDAEKADIMRQIGDLQRQLNERPSGGGCVIQ